MTSLKLLSGGAAQGLVAAVTPRFASQTGCSIDGEFGAVGTMAAKLRGGAAVDVMILTAALIEDLTGEGLLVAGSAKAIGAVETAVAVREGDSVPSIADANALREALLAADTIFVPDIVASTAGIHVAKVLAQLGILEQVRPCLKIFPNGATAMRELAASDAARPIGCTQVTEIVVTPGLRLVAPLPPACALATVYSAAVTTHATDVSMAKALIDIVVGRDQRSVRERAGFLEADPHSVSSPGLSR